MNRAPSELFNVGDVFGPYEVVRLVGKGTFGAVYEVLRGRLQTPRALKVLHAMWASEAQIVARFQREAYAVAALRHKNIVAVHELDVIEGRHVIEMEYLTGESLKDRLTRAPRLSVEEALDIVLPVISALQASHDREIVHRDIKPENIFLVTETDGNVVPKVLDFGVARMTEEGVEMTGTGQQIGTPAYMSPEQVRSDKDIDGRVDQWAVAVLLYVMLTGKKPFHGQNRFFTYELIVRAEPLSLREQGVTIPDVLEAVIQRALHKEREARYPTMRDFGVALVRFARGETRVRFDALWGAACDDATDPSTIQQWSPETKTLLASPRIPLEVRDAGERTGALLRGAEGVGIRRDTGEEAPSDAGVVRGDLLDSTKTSSGRWKFAVAFALIVFAALAGVAWTTTVRKTASSARGMLAPTTSPELPPVRPHRADPTIRTATVGDLPPGVAQTLIVESSVPAASPPGGDAPRAAVSPVVQTRAGAVVTRPPQGSAVRPTTRPPAATPVAPAARAETPPPPVVTEAPASARGGVVVPLSGGRFQLRSRPAPTPGLR
jgi:hypothetical protein